MNVTTNHVQLSANGVRSTRYATHAPNYCGHSMSNGDTQKPTRHMRRLICSLRSQNKRRKSRSTGTAVALVHGAAVRNNSLTLLVASCILQNQRGFCRLARCMKNPTQPHSFRSSLCASVGFWSRPCDLLAALAEHTTTPYSVPCDLLAGLAKHTTPRYRRPPSRCVLSTSCRCSSRGAVAAPALWLEP